MCEGGFFLYASAYLLQKCSNKKIHGNSLKNPAPTWGYKLYSNDGTFLKIGITSKPVAESHYPKWYMSDKYIIKQLFPNRRAAYEWKYKQNTIQRGSSNKNMH